MNAITVQYNCNRYYRRVREAVDVANDLFRTDGFYDRIAHQRRFDLATVSSETIAELMRGSNINVNLDLYYSLSPLHNIDGYDDTSDPFVIHLNLWRIDRSVSSLCNSIIHGCVHAVNARINFYYLNQYYFGHGDQFLDGKEQTAPYAIGAIGQGMICNDEPIIIPLEHDPFVGYKNDLYPVRSIA
jgi:hypothetical protein